MNIKLGRKFIGYLLLLAVTIILGIFAQISWEYNFKILMIVFSTLTFLSSIMWFVSIIEKVDVLKRLEN